MARELSRVFRIFVAVTLFDFIKYIELWHGCVVKRGRVCLMPVLAHFGRFGGICQQNGPTDHPADERPVKRKFGKNNGFTGQWSFGNPEHPRGGQRCFFEKIINFFLVIKNKYLTLYPG